MKENLLTIPVVSTCTFNNALERSVLFARIRLKNTLTRKKIDNTFTFTKCSYFLKCLNSLRGPQINSCNKVS